MFLIIFVFVQANCAMEIDNNSLEGIAFEQQKTYKKVPWYKRATFKRDFAIIGVAVTLYVANIYAQIFPCPNINEIYEKLAKDIKKEITFLKNLKAYQEESKKYDEELKEYEKKLKEYESLNCNAKSCSICMLDMLQLSYIQCKCTINRPDKYVCDVCMPQCLSEEWQTRGLYKCPHCRNTYPLTFARKPIPFEPFKGEEPVLPKRKVSNPQIEKKKETLTFSIAKWIFVNL